MLKRMVIGLPRSGTTWAANFFSVPGETMVHDPLYHTHYSEWRKTYDAVSCTGIWDWPEFVNGLALNYDTPIVVLHRPLHAIRLSIYQRFQEGSNWLREDAESALDAIKGPSVAHIAWDSMFQPEMARHLWRFMRMPTQFDAVRHKELARMRIDPVASSPADMDQELHRRLMAELREKRERARNVV